MAFSFMSQESYWLGDDCRSKSDSLGDLVSSGWMWVLLKAFDHIYAFRLLKLCLLDHLFNFLFD